MSIYDVPIDRLCVTLKTMLKKIVAISIFLFFFFKLHSSSQEE